MNMMAHKAKLTDNFKCCSRSQHCRISKACFTDVCVSISSFNNAYIQITCTVSQSYTLRNICHVDSSAIPKLTESSLCVFVLDREKHCTIESVFRCTEMIKKRAVRIPIRWHTGKKKQCIHFHSLFRIRTQNFHKHMRHSDITGHASVMPVRLISDSYAQSGNITDCIISNKQPTKPPDHQPITLDGSH